jgi:hypothetical protein
MLSRGSAAAFRRGNPPPPTQTVLADGRWAPRLPVLGASATVVLSAAQLVGGGGRPRRDRRLDARFDSIIQPPISARIMLLTERHPSPPNPEMLHRSCSAAEPPPGQATGRNGSRWLMGGCVCSGAGRRRLRDRYFDLNSHNEIAAGHVVWVSLFRQARVRASEWVRCDRTSMLRQRESLAGERHRVYGGSGISLASSRHAVPHQLSCKGVRP